MQEEECFVSMKMAIYMPRREGSGETNYTLILDFQPLELWENKCPLFKAPSYGVCTATRAE